MKLTYYYIPDLTNDDFCGKCRRIFPHQMNLSSCNLCNGTLDKNFTRYNCDICTGNNDWSHEPTKMFKTIEGDVCDKCFESGAYVELTKKEDLEKRYDTICYNVIFSKFVPEANIQVDVIYEYDNVPGMKHCEYYLLCLRNDKIIANYIIDTYNPYFGVTVISCDVNPEANTVTIEYSEKHKICNVTLQMDSSSEETCWNIYGLYNFKPVGTVLEFKKAGQIMESKAYW